MQRHTMGADMLYGAAAIGTFLGLTPRQVWHMCDTGRLPHWREGRVICARRSSLQNWLDQQDQAGRSNVHG